MDARAGSLWHKRAGVSNSSDHSSTSRWRTLPDVFHHLPLCQLHSPAGLTYPAHQAVRDLHGGRDLVLRRHAVLGHHVVSHQVVGQQLQAGASVLQTRFSFKCNTPLPLLTAEFSVSMSRLDPRNCWRQLSCAIKNLLGIGALERKDPTGLCLPCAGSLWHKRACGATL